MPEFLREKTKDDPALGRIAGNIGWQFADHLLRMGVGLVVGIWLARYLGPDRFGLFSYALSLVAIFTTMASLGLDDLIVREVVREPGEKDRILGTAFLLKLSGGILAFLLSFGAVAILRPGEMESLWLVGIIAAGGLFQSLNVIEFWFHAQVQAKYVALTRCCAFLFCSLIKVGLILAEAPLVAFAWVALFEVVVGMFGLFVAYRLRGGKILDWHARAARAKGLIKDSWPLLLSSMVIMIYLRIDQVMLGEMAGDAEVGIYSVAVRLAEVWYFIPSALYWSLFPGIVEAKAVDEELFYGRLQSLYNLVAFSAYAVALPVALTAHWLVPVLFGEAFARGGPMLAVLVWANIFMGLEMARSGFLTAMNWTRIYLLAVSLGCVLNVALNWLLIPRYGGMGAVVASLAAYWFAAHGSCFIFKPLRRTGGMLTRALVWPKVW